MVAAEDGTGPQGGTGVVAGTGVEDGTGDGMAGEQSLSEDSGGHGGMALDTLTTTPTIILIILRRLWSTRSRQSISNSLSSRFTCTIAKIRRVITLRFRSVRAVG